MRLKEFADRALKLLEGLDNPERPELDLLVRLESILAYDSLKQKLIELKASAKETDEANEHTLDSVIDMYKMRWRSIRLTDANYCHSPNSLASRAFLKVAEEMGKIMPRELPVEITERISKDTGKTPAEKEELIRKMRTSPYHFLFPVIKGIDTWSPNTCITSKGEGGLHNLKLNEFVFADYIKPGESGGLRVQKSSKNLTLSAIHDQNVGEPIEIMRCLRAAATTKHRVLETTCVFPYRMLEATEEARVAQHTPEAGYINTNLKRNMPINPGAIETTLKAESESGNLAVQSTYGKEGHDRLLTNIISSNPHILGLAWIMSDYLSKITWHSFLKEINIDDLRTIISDKKPFSYVEVVSNPDIYTGDKLHDAAVLYSIVFLYKLERNKLNNHTTFYGGMFYAYTKQEKVAAANVLLKYLETDFNSPHLPLEDFIRKHTPEGIDPKRLEGAVYSGELGSIAAAIADRIDLKPEPSQKYGMLYVKQ